MIIIDFSQIILANIFVELKNPKDLDLETCRGLVLNSIRLINSKFKTKYGEVVLACDSGSFWRKSSYPYYKANRKKNRDKSTIDWKSIFEIINTVRDEIQENFPYRVIRTDGAEADDVIATLVKRNSVEYINNGNKILIVSGDKDFIQLLKYPNVEIWDPIGKRNTVHNNPYGYLSEHILTGDVGDGVPNVLSPDDCLVLSKRQKPLTKKYKEAFSNGVPETSEYYANFKRNKLMIDLEMIPENIENSIIETYENESNKTKTKLVPYFLKNGLTILFDKINDF